MTKLNAWCHWDVASTQPILCLRLCVHLPSWRTRGKEPWRWARGASVSISKHADEVQSARSSQFQILKVAAVNGLQAHKHPFDPTPLSHLKRIKWDRMGERWASVWTGERSYHPPFILPTFSSIPCSHRSCLSSTCAGERERKRETFEF